MRFAGLEKEAAMKFAPVLPRFILVMLFLLALLLLLAVLIGSGFIIFFGPH